MKTIKYQAGYKYQLAEDYSVQTPIIGVDVISPFIELSRGGRLIVRKGYAWDGASGPTIDTKNSMRASLVHDALYQLMREGRLPMSNRPVADRIFHDLCVEDGMFRWRAWLWHQAVKRFGLGSAAPENNRRVIIAPGGE